MLDPLHSITNQELFERNPVRIPHQKKVMVWYPLHFVSTLFNPLHSSTNQELFKIQAILDIVSDSSMPLHLLVLAFRVRLCFQSYHVCSAEFSQ